MLSISDSSAHDDLRLQDSDLYDEDLVRAKLEELQLRRREGGVEEIAFAVRTDLVRNLGNMCNPELHKGRLQVRLDWPALGFNAVRMKYSD